ncbi:MAG: DUF4192 family protein [Catenulispora sp.]|nr:DUF4192 family protein [Catenulispora sp.]
MPGTGSPDSHNEPASGTGSAPTPGTVRLASPGSVVASIPHLFGFHPENSLVILGIGHSSADGRYIRHGVRIDLDQIRGRERAAALELAARLRDHGADIAILVAFGPRGATGATARPDHCRKLMAAFRAQIEAAPTEERVTVVDALYTCNGRWWSYMCRNTRCCPTTGTVVPAEAPPALTTALTTRGHTVYPSREALDATLAPYPPHILARTAAAAEPLDPAWYDTDPGLTAARDLMDTLLLRCGAPTPPSTSIATSSTPSTASTSAARITRRGPATTVTLPDECATAGSAAKRGARASAADSRRSAGGSITAAVAAAAAMPTASDASASNAGSPASNSDSAALRRSRSSAAESPRPARSSLSATIAAAATPTAADAHASTPGSSNPRRSRATAAESPRSGHRRVTATVTSTTAPRSRPSQADAPGDEPSAPATSAPRSRRVTAAESPRHTAATTASLDSGAIPAARSSRRRSHVPSADSAAGSANSAHSAADPALHPDAPQISDAEAAQLLIALLNWRVRDYLACAAATEESAARLLRLCTELARRAPHPELRLAPYSLAAWAAWAIGRPSIAQCAVDRALAIDPEYKFASLIRAGLHHAIDGEGVRESAASTRRDLFGEASVDPDPTDPDHAPTPVPSQRSTEPVPTDTNLEVP